MAGMAGPWGLARPEFLKGTSDFCRVKKEVRKLNPFPAASFALLVASFSEPDLERLPVIDLSAAEQKPGRRR
jgi:hypothetical protein